MMLIDSDVLIWLTRGHERAKLRLSLINPWRISAITYMELAQGCRSKQELETRQARAGAYANADSAADAGDFRTGDDPH